MPERIPPVDDELTELLEAVANRNLSTADKNRLAERLASDSDARAAFIKATAFDAMLSHEFPSAEPRVASSALDLPDEPTALASGVAQRSNNGPATSPVGSRKRLLSLSMAGIAASVLIVISLAPWHLTPKPVATLASSEDAAWESELPTTPGSELTPGLLRLRTGVATIRFHSGAEVVVEAPAQLELVSSMRGRLLSGAAVIDVPDSAIGFVIETPDGYAVDYGTRFAVRVDQHDKRSNFEIIEGEIAVHHPDTGDEVRLTGHGKAVTVSGSSIVVVDLEQQENTPERSPNVIRIGTNGRTGSAMRRDQKRHKFITRELLSVKHSNSGKWDHRSFFAFDLSAVDVDRVVSVRLRLNLVPSTRGFLSRLPKINRFGIYGLTRREKDDWQFGGTWDDSPGPDDGVRLGHFEIPRSVQRGTFGIQNDELLSFLRSNNDRPVTLILVRETTQIEGDGPGLTHLFASDLHPEAVGPMLEFTMEE